MKEFPLQSFLLKNNGINPFLNWKIIRYIFSRVLIAIFISSLSFINYKSGTGFFLVRLIQLGFFISLGIVHSDSLERRPVFSQHSIREKFYFSFVLTLLIYGSLLLYYFIIRSDMQRMALAGSSAFLLPYMIVQSWNYYLMLPDDSSVIWYGYKQVTNIPDIVYLNTLLINIRLTRKWQSKEETSFLINTPLNLELGNLFNSFLNVEKNNEAADIDCVGPNNKPFGWKFYVVCLGGFYRRVLDPSKSLQNNKSVRRKAVILAKRVIE